MPDFNWIPDQDFGESVSVEIDEVKFGDGYRQRVVHGINPLMREFTTNFGLRTRAEVQAIDAFLRARLGSHFTVTHPDGGDIKVTCDKWSRSFSHDHDCSLSATFQIWYGS